MQVEAKVEIMVVPYEDKHLVVCRVNDSKQKALGPFAEKALADEIAAGLGMEIEQTMYQFARDHGGQNITLERTPLVPH